MKRAVVLAFAASLIGQEPRFDARSRLVLVPVTVTDLQGRSIDGLEVSDFLLFDNGQSQKATVDTIDTGVAPVALVIATFRRKIRLLGFRVFLGDSSVTGEAMRIRGD
jgi:hypothetical protein